MPLISKFSVAKMEVIWRLLSLQKANECCAIKELRKTSVWKQRKNWELAQVSVTEDEVVVGIVFLGREQLLLAQVGDSRARGHTGKLMTFAQAKWSLFGHSRALN